MAVPVRRSETTPQTQSVWDPFREIADMEQRMSRLMDGLWPVSPVADGMFSPAVDIEETDDAWLVEADLPGVQKGDVSVELSGPELAITGELKDRKRSGVQRRRTRRTGRFEYRMRLPGEADPKKIDASLKDGVLTVRVPKPEQTKPRQVQIKSS
jgi:HSP20 family protein